LWSSDGTGAGTQLFKSFTANAIVGSNPTQAVRVNNVLYFTNGNTILAFDVQPDGTAVNRREFAKLEAGGAGDGLAIDAAGRKAWRDPAS
jgi:ELWxxDGT repeat protein